MFPKALGSFLAFSKAVELMEYLGKQKSVCQVCCCGFATRAPSTPSSAQALSRCSHVVSTHFGFAGSPVWAAASRPACPPANQWKPFTAVQMLVVMLDLFFFSFHFRNCSFSPPRCIIDSCILLDGCDICMCA